MENANGVGIDITPMFTLNGIAVIYSVRARYGRNFL